MEQTSNPAEGESRVIVDEEHNQPPPTLTSLLAEHQIWLPVQIAKFLQPEEAALWSQCCTLSRCTRVLPVEMLILDFSKNGFTPEYPIAWQKLRLHDFETHSVAILGKWNDHGWGQEKGELCVLRGQEGWDHSDFDDVKAGKFQVELGKSNEVCERVCRHFDDHCVVRVGPAPQEFVEQNREKFHESKPFHFSFSPMGKNWSNFIQWEGTVKDHEVDEKKLSTEFSIWYILADDGDAPLFVRDFSAQQMVFSRWEEGIISLADVREKLNKAEKVVLHKLYKFFGGKGKISTQPKDRFFGTRKKEEYEQFHQEFLATWEGKKPPFNKDGGRPVGLYGFSSPAAI